MEYLHDDENVKMMRDTARQIGLIDLLRTARREPTQARAALNRALHLLGVADDDGGAR